MSGTLLVIDDDEASCRLVKATFSSEGFDVIAAHDGPSGVSAVAAVQPDVVLLDLRLPGLGGLEVLERLKAASPSLPVIMLTASRDLKPAVRATQLGAFDYLTKPFDVEELLIVVRKAVQTRALEKEVEELRLQVGKNEAHSLAVQMGSSVSIKRVIEQAELVAKSDFTVLVLGETGTGKELVAQAIHRLSDRRKKPFVALDCGAIPEALLESELFGYERGAFSGADRRKAGHFQLADAGTCFLDEVGNLPMTLQMKLLRVLESRQVQPVGAERATPIDVRFIAATNHDVQTRARDGQFRSDLYSRLAQYTVALPALRDRREDIPYLAQRFLEEASIELRKPVRGFVPAALELLSTAEWRGNVRELRNVVRQAVLIANELVIRPQMLPLTGHDPVRVDEPKTVGRSLKEIAEQAARSAERQAITEALRATRGNKSRAARALRTDYKTLHVKMRDLGIDAAEFAD